MNDFWIFMLIMNMLIPIMMIIFGVIFKKNAPKKINMFFGYRTTKSMKNQETWKFAHYYIGRLWFTLGFIVFLLSLVIMFLLRNQEVNTISLYALVLIFIQLGFMITPIFMTEKQLNLSFDEHGTKK